MQTPTDPDGRLTAFGNQLIDVHIRLREELAALRADLGAPGRRTPDFPAHCLAFCAAVRDHHGDEDGGMFPALAGRFPELRPVIGELTRDHHLVAGLLRDLAALLDGLGPDPIPAELARVRTGLDGLAALLESHFVYEEKRLVAALNALGSPG